MNDCRELRQDVIDTCLWLKANGFVFSTWGNISVRLDDGNILITPSKVDYDTMTPEDLVVRSVEEYPDKQTDLHIEFEDVCFYLLWSLWGRMHFCPVIFKT